MKSGLHTVTNRRKLSVELEDDEWEKLKAGELLIKVFHPLWEPSGTLCVLIGKTLPSKDDPRVLAYRQKGVSFAGWPLTEEVIREIEVGDTVPICVYEGFKVAVVLKARFEKFLSEQKELGPNGNQSDSCL